MLKPIWNEGVKNWRKNNNVESGIHIMKLVIDWKPRHLLDLVISLHKLFQQQHMEVERALAGQIVFTLTEALALSSLPTSMDVQNQRAAIKTGNEFHIKQKT